MDDRKTPTAFRRDGARKRMPKGQRQESKGRQEVTAKVEVTATLFRALSLHFLKKN